MAEVERVPAGRGPDAPRQKRRRQAAQGQARLTALVLALGAAGGCVSPRPAAPEAPAALRFLPAVDFSAKPFETPAADPDVVPAAAEQLPEPRPVGAAPPAAPAPPAPVLGTAASAGGPLGLGEVQTAVEEHYPLLRAVEQERGIAGGRLTAALGAFDWNLAAGADDQTGAYDNTRTTVGVSRGLPVAGLGLSAGYRTGFGDFPTYNLGQKTADDGEFRAAVSAPLLRDRAIDRPRAAVQQAEIDVQLAEPAVGRQRLDFRRAAARAYWAWVAAGHRLAVAEALAKLAADRDAQLKARVEAGPGVNIDRVDNQQNIALRNGVLVQAQRAFQQAAIDLSLYLRDAAGRPTLAGRNRLPAFPAVEPVDAAMFPAALRAAFAARPEPQRLRLLREKAAVDLRLAENGMLPTLNAVVAATKDTGYGTSSLSGPNGLDRSSLTAGVVFQLPVERREARGRAAQAQAQIAQLDQQLRHAEDAVRADVQDAFSALERAAEFHKQAKARVELAGVVAAAEREQLRLGRSDVLRVTLREQATFDAEIVEIGARQDYFRALADFQAATGAEAP